MTIENGSPSSNSSGNSIGGGIYDAGTLSLTGDVTLTQNQATASGGAIGVDVSSGALTVTDSTLSDNSTSLSGGAIADGGSSSATLDGDRFVGNTAQMSGGGVYLESNLAGPSVVNQDEFENNTASSAGGGGLVVGTGSLSSSGSSFIDNSAANSIAGGIGVGTPSSISLVNATISGNQAGAGAGIYFTATTPTTMTNDTIAFNDATGSGGGVYLPGDATAASGSTGVRNTIIAQNTGGDCSNGSGQPPQFTRTEDAGNNLDGDGSCFRGDAASDKVDVANPLVAQPADNGGPVLTDALEPGSPAIDGGTDAGCPATDARGLTRPQGASCDIGAYEVTPTGLSLANSAPATASTGVPLNDTITASNAGPASSTGATVTDQLPADATLYGTNAQQGSCASAGFPATVTCRLGSIGAGSSATVTLVVAYSQPGSVTNTASAANNEGALVNASASTNVVAPVAPAGASAPSATTGAATGIGPGAATLTGQLGTGGQPTTYFFEYGTSGSYGSITPIVLTGAAPQNVSAAISGLKAGTTYHYRLVAINDSGSSFGGDQAFATPRSRLLLGAGKLRVKKGKVLVSFTCASATACAGSLSIKARVSPNRAMQCTVPGRAGYRIAAGRRKLVKVALTRPCLAALAAHHGKLAARLTAKPRTGQAGVVNKAVALR